MNYTRHPLPGLSFQSPPLLVDDVDARLLVRPRLLVQAQGLAGLVLLAALAQAALVPHGGVHAPREVRAMDGGVTFQD